METQFLTLDSCRREVIISLTADELQPHYEKAYQDAQPEIEVAGFRKGKVPINIIKKKFGPSIESRAMEDIASEVFRQTLESENINPIGQPGLRDIKRESDGSIAFTITYEVLPEFELQEYRNLEIEKIIRPITEEDVERELDYILTQRATLEDAEQVEDEMFVVGIKISRLDEQTGMPLLGAKSEEFNIFLKNEPADSAMKSALLNTRVGDSFRQALPTGEENKTAEMLVTVQSIKRAVPPEFSNEIVVELTGGRFHTTEELREDMEKQITSARDRMTEESLNNQLVDKILSLHSFDPPQSLVSQVLASILKEETERLPDKKLPKGFDIRGYVEAMTPTAINSAKWMIIREQIIEREQLDISDEDIDNHLNELFAMMGNEIPEANREYMRSAVAGDENLKNRLMHEKVMETLRNYAVINEKLYTEKEPA